MKQKYFLHFCYSQGRGKDSSRLLFKFNFVYYSKRTIQDGGGPNDTSENERYYKNSNLHQESLNTKIKGTVRVVSSDPLCKGGNDGFTAVPLTPLYDLKCGKYFRVFFRFLIINSDHSCVAV